VTSCYPKEMKPGLRKLLLTTHVAVSVGWLGAAAGVLALGIVGLTTSDAGVANGMYRATEIIWRSIIVPLSLAALLTGLVQALGSQWGLVDHYWVLTKLAITVGAVLLLLLHTNSLLPALTRSAIEGSAIVIDGQAHGHGGLPPRVHLVVAASGTLLLLLIITTLSIYKPWGRTSFGRRRATRS
jgi:hypothetical protein